jgi:hypothetical protein
MIKVCPSILTKGDVCRWGESAFVVLNVKMISSPKTSFRTQMAKYAVTVLFESKVNVYTLYSVTQLARF